MFRQLMIAVGLLSFLAGCMNSAEKFKRFDGSTLNSLIAQAGVPDSQRNIAGYSVYSWNSFSVLQGTSYQCTFEATTKIGSSTIIKSSVDGNIGGCNSLSRRMNL